MEPYMEDLQAIRRLKGGDIGGLECLIARYQAQALRTAFLITHDEPMAENVVQDVFVQLYRRARQLDEARPFRPYLLRSVINAALNCVKREKRGGSLAADRERTLESLLDQAAPVEEQVEFRALKAEILHALAALPPRQRAAIVGRYYLDMSEREMADAFAAPPGTVKWLLNAARKRLRSLLGTERIAE
jgi:RNA polymerase sigma-70 factor, ECF subfamily